MRKQTKTKAHATTIVMGVAALCKYWDRPHQRTAAIITILFMVALFITVESYFSANHD